MSHCFPTFVRGMPPTNPDHANEADSLTRMRRSVLCCTWRRTTEFMAERASLSEQCAMAERSFGSCPLRARDGCHFRGSLPGEPSRFVCDRDNDTSSRDHVEDYHQFSTRTRIVCNLLSHVQNEFLDSQFRLRLDKSQVIGYFRINGLVLSTTMAPVKERRKQEQSLRHKFFCKDSAVLTGEYPIQISPF